MTQKALEYMNQTQESPTLGAAYEEPSEATLPEERPGISALEAEYLKVGRTRVCPMCGNDVEVSQASSVPALKHNPDVPEDGKVYVCMYVGSKSSDACGYFIYGGETYGV